MFSGLFDMDKPFWRFMGRLPDFFCLSILFYVCCIPVVTIVPAACALFDAISRCVAKDEKGCYTRFFRTFYKELKQGIPLSLLFLSIILIPLYCKEIILYNAADEQIAHIFSLMYYVSFIATMAYLNWLIPLQSRYRYRFTHLLRNALYFSIGRLPGTVGMFLISAGVLLVSTLTPYTLPILFVAPGLIAWLHAFIVERGFEKAFPQEDSDSSGAGV